MATHCRITPKIILNLHVNISPTPTFHNARFNLVLPWLERRASPSPPPITIFGVRIPVDDTQAHLLSLITTDVSRGMGGFLFHIPGMRQYWKTEKAWDSRDLQRLELRYVQE